MKIVRKLFSKISGISSIGDGEDDDAADERMGYPSIVLQYVNTSLYPN